MQRVYISAAQVAVCYEKVKGYRGYRLSCIAIMTCLKLLLETGGAATSEQRPELTCDPATWTRSVQWSSVAICEHVVTLALRFGLQACCRGADVAAFTFCAGRRFDSTHGAQQPARESGSS